MSASDIERNASSALPPFVELRGLTRSFGSNHVLRGLDLRVDHGKILTVLGGSGSGKSVMLKHMIGLLRADAGEVRIEDTDATGFDEAEWIRVRKRIGYVFQGSALFDSLSVYENIAYPLREHEDWAEARIAERVEACLEAVGMVGIEQRMPAALSGGMRKRVAVARAIALEPDAILYDEPTTGLDPGNSRRIGRLIQSLQSRLNVTSVVVTHDLDLCRSISDQIGLLRHGGMLETGSMGALNEGRLPEIAAFLEGAGDGNDEVGMHHRHAEPMPAGGETHGG